MDTKMISNKASDVLGDLKMPFSMQRISIPISISVKQGDNHYLNAYTIKFQHDRDMMYIVWNIMENIDEDFFSEKFTTYLNRIVRGEISTRELYVIEVEDLDKLFDKIEELKSNGVINEWQSSTQAIDAFDQLNDKLTNNIHWIKKYHAIRHFDLWSTDKALELISDIIKTLDYEFRIHVDALFKPLEYPYLGILMFYDGNGAIELFKRIRCHKKFKDFHANCIAGFEDLATNHVGEDDGFMIRLPYESMTLFRDILNDLSV